MTFVPVSDSSGPTVILNAVLAAIGDITLSAASASLRPPSLPGEQAGKLWSSLAVLGQPPTLGGLSIPQRRGLPGVLFGSSPDPNKPHPLFSP